MPFRGAATSKSIMSNAEISWTRKHKALGLEASLPYIDHLVSEAQLHSTSLGPKKVEA